MCHSFYKRSRFQLLFMFSFLSQKLYWPVLTELLICYRLYLLIWLLNIPLYSRFNKGIVKFSFSKIKILNLVFCDTLKTCLCGGIPLFCQTCRNHSNQSLTQGICLMLKFFKYCAYKCSPLRPQIYFFKGLVNVQLVLFNQRLNQLLTLKAR